MTLNSILKHIISIDNTSSNRTIVYFLGFKFRHIKKAVKDAGTEFSKKYASPSEIPQATGFLRKIQLANLKFLKIFDKICSQNNFQYWLDFGNLLGAVRHKGFIPWDDDIDVGMLRDDYEEFIKKFQNGIPGFDDLYLEFNNNGKDKCFLKVKHKDIPNICIDIFPYDYYYKKTTEQEKQEISQKIYKIIKNKWNTLFIPFYINSPEKMRKRFCKIRDKQILNDNNIDKTLQPSLFYGIDYPHIHSNYVFDYEDIFPLKKVVYEDSEFSAPNNCELILRKTYGNYMEIPARDCYPRHTNSEDTADKKLKEKMDNFINQAF